MPDRYALLADTMVLAWYVLDPDRLTKAAATALGDETQRGVAIAVSAYSVVELVYMSEKKANGITPDELAAVIEVVEEPGGPFSVVTVDQNVALRVRLIPREFKAADGRTVTNADPGDRVIAATALQHGITVVSSDGKLQSLAAVLTDLRVLWASSA